MAAEEKKKERKHADAETKLLEVMALKSGDDERTMISKKLSWILRHGAKKAGLEVANDGWIKMADVMKVELMADIPEEKIRAVIEESNTQKKRYELTAEGDCIRAISKVIGADLVAKAAAQGKTVNQMQIESGNRKIRKNGEWSKGKSADASGPDAPAAPQGGGEGLTKMRQDAPPFVPNPDAQMMLTTGYQSGGMYGLPYPMMPMYGAQGYSVPPYMAKQAAANQQFQGQIKSFNEEKGFGFIECSEARQLFGRDVFLPKAIKGDLAVGTSVSFTVETNKRNMPQAKDLKAIADFKGGKSGKGGKGKGGKGMDMMGMPAGMHMPGMPPADPAMYASDPFYKTQPCPYVQGGKGGCPMSANCFFAHSPEELKKLPKEAKAMMANMMAYSGMKMPKDKKDKKEKKEKEDKKDKKKSKKSKKKGSSSSDSTASSSGSLETRLRRVNERLESMPAAKKSKTA
eukprot:gnl/MRDRNA2_/MRDRNA2_55088_c0_seq1.p1 gnl/MRDRNA2_/MRDRNA2_55088_c0~~gnl/MRDRNA2_/MRDRNA2_55088_c0_seq1.p1  ORF type:complete len:459 (-),score=145.28 gnl/MRDRNA2_/MRDRNA2_55088_c0_seq1:364-1740(-)